MPDASARTRFWLPSWIFYRADLLRRSVITVAGALPVPILPLFFAGRTSKCTAADLVKSEVKRPSLRPHHSPCPVVCHPFAGDGTPCGERLRKRAASAHGNLGSGRSSVGASPPRTTTTAGCW
jgi:hypothetical protein